MKITLKTLKQQTFVVEVDMEKDTVLALKEKLCMESGQAYPVERQRLIYLGKIMEDEQLLSQYNVDDKKFIVVMNKKPTAGVGEAAGESTAGASSAAASSTQAAKDMKTEGSSVSGAAATTATVSQSTPSTSSPAASAAEQQKHEDGAKSTENKEATSTDSATPADVLVNIQRLKEMGYSEQSARIALEICANNPDRAVEYLLSEIAGGTESDLAMGGGIADVGQEGTGGIGTVVGPAAVGTDGRGGNPLSFLRNHPVFQDMKVLLQEDPSMLPHLMQRIQTSNPDLMRIIANNQEEFLALINEPQQGNQLSQELEDIAAAMVNSLTPSDMDAIDRLKALGYPEHLVIQAYIACERDEYNAAEFLVSQTLDEEE